MKKCKRAVDGTGTTTATSKTIYLLTIPRGEALREFDKLSSQNTGTNSTHLKFIQEGLIGYFLPINALSNQKRAMCRSMRKPQDIPFRRFAARLRELNNYLPLFPIYSSAKKMLPEYLNKIILHAVPNVWEKQAYLQGWEFETKSYKDTYELFEIMEVTEKIYKYGNTPKNPPRADSNRASHGRKQKGGEAASPTNSETGRAGKRKTRNAGHRSDRMTGGKTRLFHGPRHYVEECKLLKDYATKYAAQWPQK